MANHLPDQHPKDVSERTFARRRFLQLGLLSLGIVPLAACGLPEDPKPQALPSDLRPSQAPVVPAPTDSGVDVYLVRDQGLISVRRQWPQERTAQAFLHLLQDGPTSTERARGDRTLLQSVEEPLISVPADDVDLSELDLPEGVTVLSVSEGFWETQAPDQQVLLLGQVVLTLGSAGLTPVLFIGPNLNALTIPLPGARQITRPTVPADYSSLVESANNPNKKS